jgi:hypothetical protein
MFNEFMNFLKGEPQALPVNAVDPAFVYTAPVTARPPVADMERAFARLFSTQDGRQVLGYLQAVTFQRALGPASSDEQLRYMEGQRAMVATILRLIDRGRN